MSDSSSVDLTVIITYLKLNNNKCACTMTDILYSSYLVTAVRLSATYKVSIVIGSFRLFNPFSALCP